MASGGQPPALPPPLLPSSSSMGPPSAAASGFRGQWYFGRDQLDSSPSAQTGLPKEKELSYRQQAANFIQDMGQRLQV